MKIDTPFAADVHYSAATGSTMDDARRIVTERPPTGTVCWSLEQLHGRGRGSAGGVRRDWQAAAGSALLCTILIRRDDMPAKPAASLIVCYAVVLALQELDIENSWSALQVKWPNDILFAGHKLAGILCETGGTEYMLAGIGLNVGDRPSGQELRRPAVCLADIRNGADFPPPLSVLLSRVLYGLQAALSSTPEAITSVIEQRLYQRGGMFRWQGFTGCLKGIAPGGEAILQAGTQQVWAASGELQPVRPPGGVPGDHPGECGR